MTARPASGPSARSTDSPTDAAIEAFRDRLRGPVVRPGDGAYDQDRRVWNTAVDRHPALIAHPHDAADVTAAVDFARTHDLPLAVRGGGHSPAGHGTVDDGLVVDLASMKGIEVDPVRREARVEAGLTWGEYNARTHTDGLATPGGDVAAVGLAGLTLGGGMGWLMRKHGLTIDNLLEVDLVTADCRRLTASEAEHPDLFWAIRGGGNFGIATGLRLRLQPVRTVVGGAIVQRRDHRHRPRPGRPGHLAPRRRGAARAGRRHGPGAGRRHRVRPPRQGLLHRRRQRLGRRRPPPRPPHRLDRGVLASHRPARRRRLRRLPRRRGRRRGRGRPRPRRLPALDPHRLAEVKRRYDPDNLFRLNPNIRPARGDG